MPSPMTGDVKFKGIKLVDAEFKMQSYAEINRKKKNDKEILMKQWEDVQDNNEKMNKRKM